jgi:glycogen phosphorylase
MVNKPVAYFCAEYALNPDLPIYAGGLGILAGDYFREAADQKFAVVGVGLFYDFQNSFKLESVLDKQGHPLRIEVPIQDKQVKVQVFVYMVGPNPVYLLNTNINENTPTDRQITNKLYIDDKETRLKQELILGLGGQKVLEALQIKPSIYHLNEPHSAFLILELIRHQMRHCQQNFEEAVVTVKKKVVFTNHTLVVAGREVYSNDLVAMMLVGYAEDLGIPISKIINLGLIQESSSFSMTMFSLRLAGKINAVSKLHAKKAIEVWADHPMISITNGIHIGTWDIVKDLNHHQICKSKLLQYIKTQTGVNWSPDQLLLGWARRFVEYKRPLAILENLKRLMDIANNSQYPVKIVFSGEPPADYERKNQLKQKLIELIKNKAGNSVVFLPDYDMNVGKILVSGCDVWLNTPIVGFEACGTSGMKAALNGVLPCSTKDGWVDEVDLNKIGWILDNDHLSENILDVLEQDIIPLYYQHPAKWQEYMHHARNLILNQFSTTRMLREYIQKLY